MHHQLQSIFQDRVGLDRSRPENSLWSKKTVVSYGLRAAKGSPIVPREPAVAPALGAPSGPEVNTEQLLDLSRSVYSALGSQQGAVERLRNHSPVGNWAERHSLPSLNIPYWGLTMAGHGIEIEIEIKLKSNYEK